MHDKSNFLLLRKSWSYKGSTTRQQSHAQRGNECGGNAPGNNYNTPVNWVKQSIPLLIHKVYSFCPGNSIEASEQPGKGRSLQEFKYCIQELLAFPYEEK